MLPKLARSTAYPYHTFINPIYDTPNIFTDNLLRMTIILVLMSMIYINVCWLFFIALLFSTAVEIGFVKNRLLTID